MLICINKSLFTDHLHLPPDIPQIMWYSDLLWKTSSSTINTECVTKMMNRKLSNDHREVSTTPKLHFSLVAHKMFVCLSSYFPRWKKSLLGLMLLYFLFIFCIKMKDSWTDRHKGAFWDFLQLQEAASPSKFATWQWWSGCLIQWCVSPARAHERVHSTNTTGECVQRLSAASLTTSLVCFCLCVLRLLSWPPLPPLFCLIFFSWQDSRANRWETTDRHHTLPMLRLRRRSTFHSGDVRSYEATTRNAWFALFFVFFVKAEVNVRFTHTVYSIPPSGAHHIHLRGSICRKSRFHSIIFLPHLRVMPAIWAPQLLDVHRKQFTRHSCTS